MSGIAGKLGLWFARLLIPTRCLLCQRLGEDALCQECSALLQPVGNACLRCGRRRQTAYASPDCGECHGRTLGVERARSLLVYNQVGRKLLAEFKYQRRQAAGQVLAEKMQPWLAPGAMALYGQAGLSINAVIPVPMYSARLRKRRFNQADFLAQRVAQQLGCPCRPELLERTRDTETQVGKSLNQRQENVRGAFSVPESLRDQVRGGCFIVVDDVMTTGSTMLACSRALRRAGAAASYALTAFSTSRGFEPDDDVPAPIGL